MGENAWRRVLQGLKPSHNFWTVYGAIHPAAAGARQAYVDVHLFLQNLDKWPHEAGQSHEGVLSTCVIRFTAPEAQWSLAPRISVGKLAPKDVPVPEGRRKFVALSAGSRFM